MSQDRGDYQKEGREGYLRRVLASPHLLYRTFIIWSIDSCQNRIATDQSPMTISHAYVSTHRGDVIYLELSADQLIVLLDREQCPISYFLASLGAQEN